MCNRSIVAVIRMAPNDLFHDFVHRVSSYKPISSINAFQKCRMRAYTGCIPGHSTKLTREVQERSSRRKEGCHPLLISIFQEDKEIQLIFFCCWRLNSVIKISQFYKQWEKLLGVSSSLPP